MSIILATAWPFPSFYSWAKLLGGDPEARGPNILESLKNFQCHLPNITWAPIAALGWRDTAVLEFQRETDLKTISTLAVQKDDPISGYEAMDGFPAPENFLDPSQIPQHDPENLWRMHGWQHCKPLCP